MKSTGYILVMITCSSKKEADTIKTSLLKEKKAACVNIISGVRSFFWWKNKIDSADEVLLLVKTKTTNLKEIITRVKKLHSYEIPEIIALPIIGGSKDYLEWLNDSLGCKD